MNLSELIPPVLLAAGAWQTHNRGMFMNLTVTNVPGPRRELYLFGAKMLELNPMLPLGTELTLNVAVESCADRLSVGLCCDPEKVPDLDVFKRGVARALDELLSRAKPRRRAPWTSSTAGTSTARAPGPGARRGWLTSRLDSRP